MTHKQKKYKKNYLEKNISIVIPSRSYDAYLKNCINKIRKFYKNIKIILILDEQTNNKNDKNDKNIKILISGNKSIGFKRNLGVKYVKTKLTCFIDSDAYPDSYWLNNSLQILNQKNVAAIGGPNLSPKTNDIEKILVANSRKRSITTLNPKIKSKKTKKHFISFLPSCNFIVKTYIYKKVKGMEHKIYSGEEISLNFKIKKLGYLMIFDPSIFVYHMDRNFKHFLRQRFIYGSTGLYHSLRYPCRESFMLLASSLPTLFCLALPINLVIIELRVFFLTLSIFLIIFIIFNSIKINHKKFFFKSLKLSLINFFVPGIGLVSRLFMKDKNFKKFYTQK